jgi:type IX secretion system PorP/SprF family membrane protein
MRRILFIIVVLTCSFQLTNAQQDPNFSNNIFNHIIQNPAFAGANDRWNVSGLFREQWNGLEGSPSTSIFNFDMPFRIVCSNHGIGISVMTDKLGSSIEKKMTSVGLNYAAKMNIFKGVLSLGFRANFINHSFKGIGNIPLGPEWNSRKRLLETAALGESVIDESNSLFDFGAGMFYLKNNFYFGVSASHLLEPSLLSIKDADIKLKRQYYGSLGCTYPISRRWEIAPSAHFVSDLAFYQITGNMKVILDKHYWFALSYRQDDAAIVHIGAEFYAGMKIAYSYDLGISEFSKQYNGSHELMLAYSFDVKVKKQKYSSVRFL